jgi:hypothetical protein
VSCLNRFPPLLCLRRNFEMRVWSCLGSVTVLAVSSNQVARIGKAGKVKYHWRALLRVREGQRNPCDARFHIGFTAQEKSDLAALLNAL